MMNSMVVGESNVKSLCQSLQKRKKKQKEKSVCKSSLKKSDNYYPPLYKQVHDAYKSGVPLQYHNLGKNNIIQDR